jgi:hypothetical protein
LYSAKFFGADFGGGSLLASACSGFVSAAAVADCCSPFVSDSPTGALAGSAGFVEASEIRLARDFPHLEG